VGNFDIKDFDRPVAERITPRFGDTSDIMPGDIHGKSRNNVAFVPPAGRKWLRHTSLSDACRRLRECEVLADAAERSEAPTASRFSPYPFCANSGKQVLLVQPF
jgi:hypothetical protein